MRTFIRLYSLFRTGYFSTVQVIVREEIIDKSLLDVLCDEFDGYGWEIAEMYADTAFVSSESHGVDGRECYGRLWAFPPHTIQYQKNIVNSTIAKGVLCGELESEPLRQWLVKQGYL
jgi:hypothetical protein